VEEGGGGVSRIGVGHKGEGLNEGLVWRKKKQEKTAEQEKSVRVVEREVG
jgi:hypothetical protein